MLGLPLAPLAFLAAFPSTDFKDLLKVQVGLKLVLSLPAWYFVDLLLLVPWHIADGFLVVRHRLGALEGMPFEGNSSELCLDSVLPYFPYLLKE
ncbi:hypothetical protein TNCV_4310921, partial [Trichonephila clavipes]